MPARKHYVVFVGRIPGIYDSWSECQRQVTRFLGNSYQAYPTRHEAEDAFAAFRRAEVLMNPASVALEPQSDQVKCALAAHMVEGCTEEVNFKQATMLAVILGCCVIVCAVLIKFLW